MTKALSSVSSPVVRRINEIIDARRYARHPLVAELDQLQPDRDAIGRWAAQKYHQVFLQNVIFSAIHTNAQGYEDVRQYAMDQLIAEETGLFSGSESHYGLMRRFATACGVSQESFNAKNAAPEVLAYVDLLLAECRDNPFPIALLVIYSIESQSGEGAAKLKAWLCSSHDFSEAELEWFTVHANDEDDHAASGLALAEKYCETVVDFARRAVDATERITKAWLCLHDYYLGLLKAR